MSDERRIELEVDVPVTPEEAWEAIATGPGITAWFMPAEVEGRVGGAVIYHHDSEMSSEGRVTSYDPPHRFAYEEDSGEFAPPGGPPVMATEFLVEARSGGTCVVRIVMSGFGEGEAWEKAIDSYTKGWMQALASLRLYLTHFRGEPVASVNVGKMVKAEAEVWSRRDVESLAGQAVCLTAAGYHPPGDGPGRRDQVDGADGGDPVDRHRPQLHRPGRRGDHPVERRR